VVDGYSFSCIMSHNILSFGVSACERNPNIFNNKSFVWYKTLLFASLWHSAYEVLKGVFGK